MLQKKYTKFPYEFTGAFSKVEESYVNLSLPYFATKESPRKILFVLDFVPSEDLRSGRLLSGQTGDILENLMIVAKDVFLKDAYKEFSWLAASFNAFKTLGKPKEFQQQAREAFTERIKALIVHYKPDVVMTFGPQPMRELLPEQMKLSNNKTGHWIGVPIATKIKTEKGTHKCQIVSSISLNTVSMGDSTEGAMMGYMARNVANAMSATHLYCVDSQEITDHKSILIDTTSKFDKMMDMLMDQPVVSIDTETTSLNKISNRLLTVQFAKCMKYGYLLPVYHKDTPFVASELKYIKRRLRGYFEGKNKNDYHVYANAQFDLNVLRTNLETCFMANDVWDIFAGEFGNDENLKFLSTVTGDYYYSLGNLSTQFGFNGYLTATFSKGDRKNIATTDLDEPLIRYTTLDVVVPLAIHYQQLKRAAFLGHTAYPTLIRHQFSDMIHGFSRMETNGSGLDIDWLFHLKTPDSPIEAVVKDMTNKLLQSDAVKKTNALLLKQSGAPVKTGAWAGNNITQIFNLRADAHKKMLFFNVLELPALSFGKSKDGKQGSPNLDKKFQEHYKLIPEVKMYNSLGKAKKLKNAYVNNFMKLLATDEDFKTDYRIRPDYNYLVVITGRTSAANPNLQQIPARGDLAKHIKRLFIARPGTLYIKVDYRVHEVRGWGLISFDRALAAVFQSAKDLTTAYKLHPTAELAKRLKYEADVHIVNAMYFFSKTLEQFMNDPGMMKDLRNAVKAVIFGLIYQMSLKSLAQVLNKDLAFTKALVKNFVKRFPAGMGWIDKCKEFARANLFYENPIGFRRHLWAYMLPKSMSVADKVHAQMDRQAVNSPIQGMGAQFMAIGSRALDKMIFKLRKTKKRILKLWIANSVHDSLEIECAYEDFILGLDYVERALTDKVRDTVQKRHGFELVVDLEIDFEIGAALSQVDKWDFSVEVLEERIKESLIFQRDVLKHELDVDKTLETIFNKTEDMPKWMRKQIKNLGYKFEYQMTAKELKAKYRKIDEAKAKAAAKEAVAKAEAAAKATEAEKKDKKEKA